MKIITRTQWGARHGDGKGEALLPATSVWLHHSVTVAPDIEWVDVDYDRVDDDEERAMRTIEGIGAQRFGTVYGFPYSLAAMPRGHALYEGHDIGQQGAHTYGYNHTGRAIVLVGNYEKYKPTDAQLDAVAWGLVEGKRRGWWREARLSGGHSDVKATACPGKYAYAAIPEINRRAAAIEEDDMPYTEKQLQRIVRDALDSYTVEPAGRDKELPLPTWLRWRLARRDDALRAEAKIDRIIKAISDWDSTLGARLREALADSTVTVDVSVRTEQDEAAS